MTGDSPKEPESPKAARPPADHSSAEAEEAPRSAAPPAGKSSRAGCHGPYGPCGEGKDLRTARTDSGTPAATKTSSEAVAEPAADEDEYEKIDTYTADITCKCGRSIAANAWFCPQCGRPYLVNMLFALVVLATGFALLNQLVMYLLSLFSRTTGG